MSVSIQGSDQVEQPVVSSENEQAPMMTQEELQDRVMGQLLEILQQYPSEVRFTVILTMERIGFTELCKMQMPVDVKALHNYVQQHDNYLIATLQRIRKEQRPAPNRKQREMFKKMAAGTYVDESTKAPVVTPELSANDQGVTFNTNNNIPLPL